MHVYFVYNYLYTISIPRRLCFTKPTSKNLTHSLKFSHLFLHEKKKEERMADPKSVYLFHDGRLFI